MYSLLQQKRHLFALLALCFVGLMVLAQPAAAQCAVGQQGGPSVFYEGCAETTGNGANQVTIPAEPAGYTAGDLMLLSISTDGTTDPTPQDSSGWTELNTLSTQGVTLSLWYRTTASTAGTNRIFDFGANEAFVATYMRFSNAESLFATYASGDGDPVAPALTTDRDNSLILRLSAKDWRDTNLNGGLTQITSSGAGTGNSGVDTAVGFVNAATSGTNLPTYAFTNTQNDGWHAVTIAIRPPKPAVAFRITHGGSNGSTCTSTLITFTAVNEDGGTVTGYTGALTIGSPTGLGNWSSAGDEVGGTFSNGTANDGSATYTMVAGDLGTVAFNYIPNRSGPMTATVSAGGISESSHAQGSTQLLNVDACGFTISHDGTHGTCAIAGYQEILITAVQADGTTTLADYTGTIRINTPGVSPTWSISIPDNEAYGTLTVIDPFTVEYTFDDDAGDGDGADNGQVTLRFDYDFAATVDFDFIETLNPGVDALLGTDQNLEVTACGFSVIPDDLFGPTCAYEIVTLSSNVPGNTETITVTTSTTAGVWVPESAMGAFSPLGNGNFEYIFDPGDSDVATFRLYHQPTGTVSFDVSGSEGGVQVGADDPIDFQPCEFVFTAPASGNNCTPTSITLTVVDQGMNTVVGYTGTVTLSTDSMEGTWGQGSATNVPNNSPGNGQATLAFATADSGTVTVSLSHESPDASLTLDANDASYAMTTPSNPVIDLRACYFYLTFGSASGSTCRPTDVTITVRDSSNVLVPGYVGTATITTTSTNGDWSLGGATNTATFTNVGDGEAEYYFGPSAGGSVTLTFTNTVVETTEFQLIDDASLVPGAPGNPTLGIGSCKFVISHGNSSDICSPAAITFTLYDPDDQVVTDYEGYVYISTSLPGTWTDGVDSGITDTGGGNAEYQFTAGNSGTVTFNFQGNTIATYDIDIDDGPNQDNDGNATDDPDYTFTTCLPTVTNFSCVEDSTASVTLLSSTASLGTRAVVMVTGYVGTTAITDATFDGVSAPANGQLLTVANTSNPANQRTMTEMFAWLDSDLPSDGGTYSGSFTADNGQSMCLIALKNVEQTYPSGAQLGSAFADGGTIQTSLTSPATNTLVVSAVTNDNEDATGFDPNNLNNGTQIYNLTTPASWAFSVNHGTTAGTGTVTITETFNGTVDKWTLAAAAFAPAPAPLSYFKITHDGSTTSCTKQSFTIAAYDLNGNIKTDYTGTITLTTDQLHGTWSQFPATGTLTENPLDDDGEATYEFAVGDNGVKTLFLLNPHNETTVINVVDGSVSDDDTHAALLVTSCQPIITETQCYQGTSGSVDIVGSETSSARAVLMTIARESTTGNDPQIDPDLVLFDTGGSPMTMTLVVSARVEDDNSTLVNTSEMYVIFDEFLPATAGTYNASFTELSGTFPNTPGMCLTSFYGVEQTVPVFPAVGATTSTVLVTPASATTSINTTGNNALVFSAASDDRTGGTYSSDFDTTLWNGVTQPENAVFAGFSQYKPQAGLIKDEVVPTTNPDVLTHIMASFAPVVAGDAVADGYVPVTLFKTFSGPVNYRAYGSSYRTGDNSTNASACTFVDSGTGTSITLDIPEFPGNSTIKAAYLYWAGSGSDGQFDSNVVLSRGTATVSVDHAEDEMFIIRNVGSLNNLDYFAGYADVTSFVTANGTYTLTGLDAINTDPWLTRSACASGWSLVVVFENSKETVQVINLFHGFQPFQNSQFELVPRNFRIRALEAGNGIPHGQLTHITVEGDDTLNTVDERLGLQDAPESTTFNYLTNGYNPATAQYNNTVTRPVFDPYPVWSPTAGAFLDGIEALSTTDYGFDVDTHYLEGDTVGTPLYPFGTATPAPERITTEYSAGQDLVLLLGEVISVTNEPIVDMEVDLVVPAAGSYVTGGVGSFTITVTNNGDGPIATDGNLTGSSTLTMTLPAGLTINSITDGAWDCVFSNAPPNTSLGLPALACEYDISSPLIEGASLDQIVVEVTFANEVTFPSEVNQEFLVARALYHGGSCVPNPLDTTSSVFGRSPDPEDCNVSPQFDNVMDLEGGAKSMNDLDDATVNNNNVDREEILIYGPQTNLSITKIAGFFQENSLATYTITVTNLGPQTATKLMTVTDTLTVGLDYFGILEVGDDDGWSCIDGVTLSCTTDVDLAPGETADFQLGVLVSAPLVENETVDNTACVTIATGNFDNTFTANNCYLEDDIPIQGEPVAAQNKFLISVNYAPTTIGSGTGTLSFNIDDIILYDPLTDIATMFFDDSVANSDNLEDINALHVRKNGHIIMSTLTGTSTIGSPTVTVEQGDLVVYDPILNEATLLFDGSAYFDSPTTNIDAIFEQDDGQVVISTTADAGMGGESWGIGDWVRFDPANPTSTVSVILDGTGGSVFGTDVQLNGTYFKVGSTPTYVITIGQNSATIDSGNSNTSMTGDDIASIQPFIVDSQLEFRGNIPNGVFTPTISTRYIDGVHLVEDGYFGHFAIAETVSGNTCTPTTFTISKHTLSHTVDTGYTGSIFIDMDYAGTATVTVSNAAGTLQQTTGNQWVYTFVPGDNGDAEFSLTVAEDGIDVNLDVSNGLRRESSTEDPDMSFSDVNSVVTYGDNFNTNTLSGSSGSSSWKTDWAEVDPDGLGVSTGNVRITGGEAFFDNVPNTIDNSGGGFDDSMPGLTRTVDLSLYSIADPLVLTFNYRTVSANAADAFIVEVKGDTTTGDPWLEVTTYDGLTGTNSGMGNFNLTTILASGSQSVSANTGIRFRVEDNYDLTGSFVIDNVVLTTSTTDCGVGAVHHYEIIHSGTGVMCQAYPIQFVAHDIAHTPVAPGLGTVVNLSTSSLSGDWFDYGAFDISDLTPGDGAATYSFGIGQTSFTGLYNLTSVSGLSQTISFNVNQAAISELEDPAFTFHKSGFVFKDSPTSATVSTVVAGMDIGTQIAGKPSTNAPANRIFIMAVDSADGVGNETLPVCTALFSNQPVTIEIEAECVDPAGCSQEVNLNGTDIATHAGYTPGSPGPGTAKTDLLVNFDASGAAELEFQYDDVGQITLHAEYEIPLRNIGDDGDPDFFLSGDDMVGSSAPFVVRPFGFNIDLGAGATATTTNGTAFKRAGETFNATIQAVTWEDGDDADNDGFPDPGANLANGNFVTPNFGSESVVPVVTLTHTVSLPLTATLGVLQDTTFNGFSAGTDTNNSVSYSEVGIINLSANLVGGDYLGTGDNIYGALLNVGRFTPYQYRINNPAFTNRYALSSFCSPPGSSTFTYMGEGLQIEFEIRAENAAGDVTENYYAGFEKLTLANQVGYYATDLDTMDVLSGRLDVSGMDPFGWESTYGGLPSTGNGSLSGLIVVDKDTNPDGPYNMFALGVIPVDSDGIGAVTSTLTLDVGGTDTVSIIPGTTSIRYGRLTMDSTGGPDISTSATPGAGEDIPITFVLEYYNSDSSNYLVNPLDDCTTLTSENLSLVSDSYTDDLANDGMGPDVVTTSPTITIGITSPTTTVLLNGSTRATSESGDVPFYISSPLPADSTTSVVGSVILELDLGAGVDIDDDDTDDVTYDYLLFNWRTAGDLYDETPDGGNIEDNPRAIIDFGSFQGHSRVINWQEILLTPE